MTNKELVTRIDVDSFSEYKNLVFIDEGHKGSKSEEQTWKNLRQHLTRGEGSFTFEYSATFGQVIKIPTENNSEKYQSIKDKTVVELSDSEKKLILKVLFRPGNV